MSTTKWVLYWLALGTGAGLALLSMLADALDFLAASGLGGMAQ